MPGRTFSMIDDRSGKTADATIDTFADYQAKGYRVADAATYQAAQFEAATPMTPTDPAPGEVAMRELGVADAAEIAAEQNPEAKPQAADKPKSARKG